MQFGQHLNVLLSIYMLLLERQSLVYIHIPVYIAGCGLIAGTTKNKKSKVYSLHDMLTQWAARGPKVPSPDALWMEHMSAREHRAYPPQLQGF